MPSTQQNSKSLIKTVLPLASLTAIGMLATDLYLPAVPLLSDQLGGTLSQSQMTLASFIGCLAFSQLIWGWASDRFGEDLVLKLGMILLFSASVFCAVCGNIEFLILGRAIQGFGAGAATTAVPALLRRSFHEVDAVKSISIVAMAESVVPALGPVLGALLISFTSWRFSFWVIAILTALLTPFVSQVTSRLSGTTHNTEKAWSSFMILWRDKMFLGYSFAYAIMFGALILFVASAPQIISKSLLLPIQYFSFMQVLGVASFIASASQGGKLVEKHGTSRTLWLGSLLQISAGLVLIVLGLLSKPPFLGIALGWCLFCAGLGFRGPSTMAKALSSAGPRSGQASGFLMFLSFGFASAAVAAVAPFLDRGLFPVALTLFLMTLASSKKPQ